MRKLRLLIGIVAITVVACVPAAVSYASTPSHSAGETPMPTPEESHAMQLRAMFGLPATLSAVTTAENDPSADLTELGIPLTAPEKVVMEKRDQLPAITAEIRNIIDSRPDFAGIWIDQANGGIINVRTTGATADVRNLVQPAVPDSFTVVVTPATYTLTQLQQYQQTLNALVLSDPAVRKDFAASLIDVKQNQVTVSLVAGASSETVSKIDALGLPGIKLVTGTQLTPDSGQVHSSGATQGNFLPGVHTQADSPDAQHGQRDISSGPVLGGAYISEIPSGGSGACTMGFSSYSSKTDGKPYGITAGHCGGAVDYFQGYSTQGAYLGTGHEEKYSTGGSGNCDCVLTGPLPAGPGSNVSGAGSKLVYVANLGTYSYGFTGTGAYVAEGQKVCMSGATYAYSNGGNINCGVMDGRGNVQEIDGAFEIIDAGVAAMGTTVRGDSGAPYGNGKAFLGVHAGSGMLNGAYYTAFSLAVYFNQLNVNVSYGG